MHFMKQSEQEKTKWLYISDTKSFKHMFKAFFCTFFLSETSLFDKESVTYYIILEG